MKNAIDKANAIADIYDHFMSSDMALHNETAKKCIEILNKQPIVTYEENDFTRIIENIKADIQSVSDYAGRDMETAEDVNEKVYNAGVHEAARRILKLVEKDIKEITEANKE